MIYNKRGQSVELDGVLFKIGMRVKSNDASDYANLYGTVTEIRTEDDQDTDNDMPDIYCRFEPPVMPEEIREMEEHFSRLYGMPKKIEDIALDMVIMEPDMLEPLDDLEKDRILLPIYVVIDDWCIDREGGHNEHLFTLLEDAKRTFHEILSIEQREGCVTRWQGQDDFNVDTDEDSYECWLTHEYCENHFKLSIEEKTVTVDKAFLQRLLDGAKGCGDAAC